MDNESIEERISARILAEQLRDLIADESDSKDFRLVCLTHLAASLGLDVRVEQPDVAIKQHEPIRRLGATKILFGGYKGKTFDEIDVRYLDWLCGVQEEFLATLKSYLGHPDFDSYRSNER